jgi:predicted ABC-type ATPase
VNCHCLCQPRVDKDILGLSLEERRELQAKAIAEDDGEWEKELDAKNRARAGIEENPDSAASYTNPGKSDIIDTGKVSDYGYTNTADRREGDSLSLFTDANGQLTAECDALHKQLIDETFKGVTPVDGKATFTVMGGGSAAGKSTMINGGAVTLPANSVMLDSDAIKTKLPEYIKMVATGDDTAAAFVHEESSALAKRMLGIANAGNYNAVLDGTGDGSVASLTKKIMDAKNAGMTVKGVYATVPTETALERSMLRAAKTGRMVPVDDIINIHRKVSEILPQCASLFDAVELYDTTGDAILIAVGGNGHGLTAVPGQESLFEAFLAKALK